MVYKLYIISPLILFLKQLFIIVVWGASLIISDPGLQRHSYAIIIKNAIITIRVGKLNRVISVTNYKNNKKH
jgi:hypothetical protein